MKKLGFSLTAFLIAASFLASAEFEIHLNNATFTDGADARGVPTGWSLYGGHGRSQSIKLVEIDGTKALLLEDGDAEKEVGIVQQVPLKPGIGYEVRVKVRAVPGASSDGANVQLRFLPSHALEQAALDAISPADFNEVTVAGMAPPDTTSAVVYLYTHAAPTPKLLIGGVKLVGGVAPPPPPPPPVPPQYSKLKDLHLVTDLVKDGQPQITIVAPADYKRQARQIQDAIKKITRATVPIVSDDAPEAAVPIRGNLIVLGNRSTNRTISELYNRYFCLTDLRYPGTGGYELRTLHNPFGSGHNVIICGGSDATGVAAATDALITSLPHSHTPTLSIGRLMEIKLGKGIVVPKEITALETWEASKNYGSVGYFGWNSISKRMAAYYMTGDAFHAREAVRLAFPDKQAFKEITEIDTERIENKDDPLAGPYHYNAHLMILFWNLIEESPVFTDEERLKITNAFARQLTHRKDEGVYTLTRPASAVSSRHGQWSAISLYCLGRYFQRDYPNSIWAQCVRGAEFAFAPLHKHAWVNGESDNLFWYCTGIAPIFSYMLLSGDRAPLQNGVAATLLRGQELLISGRVPDWTLSSAALDYLHKVTYLTQDGRWLAYRDRTEMDTGIFRLGQSFWPEEHLKPKPPLDLVGKWTVNYLPKPHWLARGNGFSPEESFQNASYRSAPDASGDFILIDGFNGASRNPYHCFAVLELRLDGNTILQGYNNQVLTKADGMVDPQVAMDGALRYKDVIGQTAACVGEVPKAAFCNWRRTLIQRNGRYALVVDDLAFRADSENMEVQIKWENGQRSLRFDPKQNVLTLPNAVICSADVFDKNTGGTIATQEWHGAVHKGQRRVFFSLIGGQTNVHCARLSDNAAALALPQPAVAVAGQWQDIKGELVVLAADHLYGHALTRAGFGQPLLGADAPVNVDWDFATGELNVVATKPIQLNVAGEAVALKAGRHVLHKQKPANDLSAQLSSLLARATEQRAAMTTAKIAPAPAASPLTIAFTANVGGSIVDLITIPAAGGEVIAAAEGRTIHLLTADGKEICAMQTDGNIRVLHWWPEHKLLLAGCADEKVVAFNLDGVRQWTFVSVMDPAVFRAAKPYWFKSAPGHEGVHGVFSGVFLDGRSQAFVGSACTLEIIDEHGKLLHRMPQFWGTVYKFAIMPGPDGSVNLLASRKITDGATVAVINNKTLDPKPRSFYSVPAGNTYVAGWMSETRHHIFFEDIADDGKKVVVSEITGGWNRVTVWDTDGKALASASFGPGTQMARNIRDLDIGDINGDGKMEILVPLASGLLVALDYRCGTLWSKRLSSPPTVLKIVGKRVVVGSEDGSVAVFDGSGNFTHTGKVTGRPMCIQRKHDAVVIAADKGEVKAFVVP